MIIAQAQSIAADGDAKTEEDSQESTAAGVTAGNVRITKRAEKDLGPCAALACPAPVGRYAGGAHVCTSQPVGDGLDSHHTPAKANSYLDPQLGPAIQMDPADHALTASYRKPRTAAYMRAQKSLVDNANFMGALMMDVADIRSKFGDKYDAAIAQMTTYAACLKQNGIVR
ncbi:hypothetical protein JMK10_16855 [Rhodovulum sulfidophilum]|nr:hypothetical protein [Rhodovulum sulfidophilum]MBL3573372.1 hypothetical protein [Rhodovulum sulfidophilum]MCF4118431.1 hypothetical protein [Rhodovulum sulfidophilum]